MRRYQGSWIPRLAAVAVALLPAMAAGQSSTSRDSTRVYRLQVRSGDAEYERTLRRARQQLEERLDSLQHEFEGLGPDAPDRVGLSRQVRTLISSLDDLRQLRRWKQGIGQPAVDVEEAHPGATATPMRESAMP